MNILRKFIIKEWLKYFVIVSTILLGLVFAIKLLAGILRHNVTIMDVFANNLISIPQNIEFTFPIAALVTSILVIGRLKRTNEIIAIMSFGYNFRFLLITFALPAILVSCLQVFVLSFIEPYMRIKKDDWLKDKQGKFSNLEERGLRARTITSGKVWYKSDNYFFSFTAFDKKSQALSDVDFFILGKDTKILEKKIKANKIYYNQKNNWVIKEGVEYHNLSVPENIKIIPVKEKVISLNQNPSDFQQLMSDITTLNIFKLWNYITILRKEGINADEYLILMLKKIFSSICTILFALIALSSITKNERNDGQWLNHNIILGIIAIFYFMIDSYFLQLGRNSQLNPFLSALLTPLLLMLLLYCIFPKELKKGKAS